MKYTIYFYIFFIYTILALLIGKMPFLYINLECHPVEINYIQAAFWTALAIIFLAPYLVVKYLKLSLIAQSKTISYLWGIGVCIIMGLVALETYFYSSAVNPQAKEFWLIYTLGEVAVLNFVFCILLSSLFKNVKFGDSTDTFQQVLGKPDKIEELEDDCIEYIYSSGLCASFDSKRICYAIKYTLGSDYHKMLVDKNTSRIGKFLNRLKNNNRTEMRLFMFAILVFGFVFLMLFASRPETVEQRSKAVKSQDSKYKGLAVDDFKTKFRSEKGEFVIVGLESIELKIGQIPAPLRKYYSYERAVTGSPNHASQYTLSKGDKSLTLQIYCLSRKIRYIKIIYNRNNKDFALKIKKYLTNKFPEILTSMEYVILLN